MIKEQNIYHDRLAAPTEEREFVPLILNPGGIRRLSQSGWYMERFYRSSKIRTNKDSRRKLVPRADIISAVAPQMYTLTGRRVINAAVDGMIVATGGESLTSTHGGSTLQTILSGDQFNGPEILRTFARIPGTTFTRSESNSEIPFYERLASMVRRRLSFPNIEYTLPKMTRNDFPTVQAEIATRVERALEENNHRVARSTDPDGTIHLVTPFDPYIFNTTHHVLGYIRTAEHDIYNHEKVDFPFRPTSRPDHIDISVKQIHPQGNPDWTILRTQFACRDNNGGDIDVVDLFAKPLPHTRDEKIRDDRMGWVPTSQLVGDIWRKDGTVSIPPRNQVFADPRLHPKSFKEKKLGSLAVAWTRILRGETIKSAFTNIPGEIQRINFPDQRPDTLRDMQQAAICMAELWGQGQRYGDPIGKRVELATDTIIALHYNPYAALRTWWKAIPRELYETILPHMPLRHLIASSTNTASEGKGILYYPWKNELVEYSGIPGLLQHVQYEIDELKHNRQDYWTTPEPTFTFPRASDMAKAIWMADMFPD